MFKIFNFPLIYCIICSLFPTAVFAQNVETAIRKQDSTRVKKETLARSLRTTVSGKITDANDQAVPFVTVAYPGSTYGANSNSDGAYTLSAPLRFFKVTYSCVGYVTLTRTIRPGEAQVIDIRLLQSKNQLNEVKIVSGKKTRYHNKGNPAVELIQLVIDHKEQNRMLSADYLQYNQYERIGFSIFDISKKFLGSKSFSKYRFLLDTAMVINDSVKTALPFYMSEKYFQVYSRKSPPKTITRLTAHKEVNFSQFIDTAGLDIYLNRLYGNPDIYSNNIFILTNQFLSPIADHARDFYKFFISDTIQTPKGKLIEISFTPRNLGDLLFEGKLYITMDGRYAVKSDYLNINKHININFVRGLDVRQDFEQFSDGRFYLVKTDVQSDFGVMKNTGLKVFGDRTVFFTNYKPGVPQPPPFYDGKSTQAAVDANHPDPNFWLKLRTDTLRPAQAKVYQNIDSLQKMPSFKKTLWIASFVTGGYADLGPVQLGPVSNSYSYNPLEGNRIGIGGRTTPLFNRNFYLEGYTAYGTKDQKLKYYLEGIYSFNQTPTWRYPNNYLKVSYQYDTDIPGQNFLIDKAQSALASLTRGSSDLWQYNRIFKIGYYKDLENHFSFNLEYKYWNQQPADKLTFQPVDAPANEYIHNLTTSEFDVTLRYAPHEQIFQGKEHRHTIPSKYPIFTLKAGYGIKGPLQSSYNYLNLSGNIYKRFYLSQLGYTDVTLLGGLVEGKVPFPFLSILPANQTYLYNENAYNDMSFLEFVSDHYVGLNLTHAFGGFLLNKVPVLKQFKLREFLSAKVLYGGLSNLNNPVYNPSVYKFPVNASGIPLTYPLGNSPYVELGFGVGNIFKVLRLDVIRRFDYLNHPGATPIGFRFSFTPEL